MTDTPTLKPFPRPLVWFLTLLKYAVGIILWFMVLGALATYGRINVWSWVDGLWMQPLHDGLVRNAIGAVAYRAEHGYGDYGWGPKYIYSLEYQLPDDKSPGGARKEIRSLTSMVDVASWHEAASVGPNVTLYLDAKYKYAVRTTSNGTDISVADK